MSSFQDQLLKAGVIDAKKARKANREKHRARKLETTNASAVDEVKRAAASAQAEKVERDRQLNIARKAAADAKAVEAQIRQLIETNRLPEAGDDAVAYHFADKKSVKKIYVSTSAKEQLAKGLLAIVKLGDGYELVPAAVADKIRQRDETVVRYQQHALADAEDDQYADHPVPDDLMW